MFGILIATVVIVLLGLLGSRYGADSRTDLRFSARPEAEYRREHSVREDLRAIGSWARRMTRRFVEAQRREVDLQERMIARQRVPGRRPMRWVRSADGWRLDGEVAEAPAPGPTRSGTR